MTILTSLALSLKQIRARDLSANVASHTRKIQEELMENLQDAEETIRKAEAGIRKEKDIAWEYYQMLQSRGIRAPYQTTVKDGFSPCNRVIVVGIPGKDAKTFDVTFLASGHDSALYLSIRFEEKLVTRNSYQDGKWQIEETEGEYPLAKDGKFELGIWCGVHAFHIWFSGKHFAEFRHRLDPKSVERLTISGDVELQSVRVE